MLRVEQLFERILLGGIGQQGEHHAIHAIGRRDRAGVELRDGRGMALPLRTIRCSSSTKVVIRSCG